MKVGCFFHTHAERKMKVGCFFTHMKKGNSSMPDILVTFKNLLSELRKSPMKLSRKLAHAGDFSHFQEFALSASQISHETFSFKGCGGGGRRILEKHVL